jgi:hypothetical protein
MVLQISVALRKDDFNLKNLRRAADDSKLGGRPGGTPAFIARFGDNLVMRM